jgi:hypothetical protein
MWLKLRDSTLSTQERTVLRYPEVLAADASAIVKSTADSTRSFCVPLDRLVSGLAALAYEDKRALSKVSPRDGG